MIQNCGFRWSWAPLKSLHGEHAMSYLKNWALHQNNITFSMLRSDEPTNQRTNTWMNYANRMLTVHRALRHNYIVWNMCIIMMQYRTFIETILVWLRMFNCTHTYVQLCSCDGIPQQSADLSGVQQLARHGKHCHWWGSELHNRYNWRSVWITILPGRKNSRLHSH